MPLAKWWSRRSSGKQPRRRQALPFAAPPPNSKLPPPLFDLCNRLTTAFSLAELKDLAFTIGIDPESVPDDTRPAFALGLARAAWCRGYLDALLAEAARQVPAGEWLPPALPTPPEQGCEDDPLPRPSVFRDSRQVAVFVLIPLLAAALVATLIWWTRQPARLDADFNVAVAAIDTTGGSAAQNEQAAALLQQVVVDELERQLNAVLDEEVIVSDARMPVVAGEDDAEQLAKCVNAQLVIYGRARVNAAGQVTYSPHFYVYFDPARQDVAELTGDYPLDVSLTFALADLMTDRLPPAQTAAGAALLTRFGQALVYLKGGDLDNAYWQIIDAVGRTKAYAVTYGPFSGREVIYLFAGHIARLKAGAASGEAKERLWQEAQAFNGEALAINPTYARALIAQANLAYDRGDLAAAEQGYAAATALHDPPPPPKALIEAKAAMGLGNVYLSQLNGPANGTPCADERRRLADEGLAQYGRVLAEYDDHQSEELLAGMAGQAYLHRGEIYAVCGEKVDAADALRIARAWEGVDWSPEQRAYIDKLLAAVEALPE